MEYVHFATIKAHQIAVFVVPDNSKKPTKWAKALLAGKSRVERAIRNYRMPFVGRINSEGALYQLRCYDASNTSPADGAVLIKDGKTDFELAKKHRNKAT